MDHQSIVEQTPAPPVVGAGVSVANVSRTAPPSVSAGIAAASAHQPKPANPSQRFPGEDGGRSLTAMAYRDLDAALQLLAERAQYITGASGAMIALRRGEHDDMLCRASAGTSAPELGALLSMEYGFSGESVRTRQALRCDDAERDPRVNREGCRQLGIASVVVVPILSDQQVLGVFELFSGKPSAFEERDLSALRRLSEMVETAVKYAVAAQTIPAAQEDAPEECQPPVDEIKPEVEAVAAPTAAANADSPPAVAAEDFLLPQTENAQPEKAEVSPTEVLTTELERVEAKTGEPAPKKPLFWSAAVQIPTNAGSPVNAADSVTLPAVLRNLHKCQACGFPVSQGRKYCVECEEKQWRGEVLPKANASVTKQVQSQPAPTRNIDSLSKEPYDKEASAGHAAPTLSTPSIKETNTPRSAVPAPIVAAAVPKAAASSPVKTATITSHAPPVPSSSGVTRVQTNSTSKPAQEPAPDNSTLFLSATVDSESWLTANKYILGALILVAMVIAAVALLR